MPLASTIVVTDQDVRSTSTVQGGERAGQVAVTTDGRQFRYAANTSTSLALAPGKLTQGAVSTTNHVNRTSVAIAAGTTQITCVLGNTAVTADQYRDGYVIVNAGTGLGQTLGIAGHNVPTVASSTYTIVASLTDGVLTTLDTTSKLSFHPNPWSACLISSQAASTTALPTGVPQISIAAATTALPSNWFWAQTGGVCSVLANGTIALANGVIAGATTDGSVDGEGTSAITPRVGYTIVASVTTEYRPVFLQVAAA